MSHAFVDTDRQLAAILGVTRQAVANAESRGTITREDDGRWDALRVVADWRASTVPSLQRPRRAIGARPWLNGDIPLRRAWAMLVRRCTEAGAEWHR
jgi:hypothetical protein